MRIKEKYIGYGFTICPKFYHRPLKIEEQNSVDNTVWLLIKEWNCKAEQTLKKEPNINFQTKK